MPYLLAIYTDLYPIRPRIQLGGLLIDRHYAKQAPGVYSHQ